MIVQFGGVLGWLQNKYIFTLTGAYFILSEAALLHHRVIIYLLILCMYVESIPHCNYIHCTAFCHCLHACIRVLRELLVKWDPQDMP